MHQCTAVRKSVLLLYIMLPLLYNTLLLYKQRDSMVTLQYAPVSQVVVLLLVLLQVQ
jgi:hypothetical protein